MLRVLSDNLRVLLRVMGKTVKSTSNPDNWYQRALKEDPEGAAEFKRQRAAAARDARAKLKLEREAAAAASASPFSM